MRTDLDVCIYFLIPVLFKDLTMPDFKKSVHLDSESESQIDLENDDSFDDDINDIESNQESDETELEESDNEEIPQKAEKYVPPHLRQTAPSVTGAKVKRQLVGLLNRLGDSNLESVVSDIEACLRTNTRNGKFEI